MMEPFFFSEREQAHAYLDHLPGEQVSAICALLEAMLDPVSRHLANAPIDDSPLSEEDQLCIEGSRRWRQYEQDVPLDQVANALDCSLEEAEKYLASL